MWLDSLSTGCMSWARHAAGVHQDSPIALTGAMQMYTRWESGSNCLVILVFFLGNSRICDSSQGTQGPWVTLFPCLPAIKGSPALSSPYRWIIGVPEPTLNPNYFKPPLLYDAQRLSTLKYICLCFILRKGKTLTRNEMEANGYSTSQNHKMQVWVYTYWRFTFPS